MVIYVLGERASAPAAYWEASGSALGEVLWRASWGLLWEAYWGVVLGKLTGE